jgi:hypothetical protein
MAKRAIGRRCPTLLAFLRQSAPRRHNAEDVLVSRDAVAATVGALRTGLPSVVTTIVGPGSGDWLLSGDEVADAPRPSGSSRRTTPSTGSGLKAHRAPC